LDDLSQTIKSWRVDAPRQEESSHATTARHEHPEQTINGRSAAAQLAEIEQLKRDGDFTGAMRKLEDVVTLTDVEPAERETALCLQAEFEVLGGDFQGASNRYDSILADNPLSARALCGKGALAAEAQDWTLAQSFFKEALVAESNCDIAFAGLGLCAMVENRSEDAFTMFQRAMEANPENQRALLGVLQTGYPLRRFTEMERMISAYLDLHPDSVDMLYSLAGVLFAQGKVNEARLEVEKILVVEPDHEHALELRGMIEQNPQMVKDTITQ
jgi:tetratricopeptide (TPR) repeat protein